MFAQTTLQSIAKAIKLITAFSLSLFVLGCSTPTTYGPAEDGKGYSERQTESDRYRVSFAGNSLTSRETVESYLLYRAAEVTLQSGNNHFRIVTQDLETTTTYFDTVTASPAYGGFGYSRYHKRRGFHGSAFGGFSTVRSHPITSYEAVANIIVFSAKESAGEERLYSDHTYNASDVIKRLEPMIVRREDETG